MLLGLHLVDILKKDKVPLLILAVFLVLLIPIYSFVFATFYVNHDNLLLGMLSGLMLNQHFKYEHSQKRHLLALLGVRPLTYYASFFVLHYAYFMIFAAYIAVRVQFWENSQYNKTVYICSRLVAGVSLIPLMYLMGHFLKRTKNAEMYTVLVLFLFSWLLYNAFIVFQAQIYQTLYTGFPDSLVFYFIFLNPFIYVIELTTMSFKLRQDGIPETDLLLALTTGLQVLLGALVWVLFIALSNREQLTQMRPEVVAEESAVQLSGELGMRRPLSEMERIRHSVDDSEMLI